MEEECQALLGTNRQGVPVSGDREQTLKAGACTVETSHPRSVCLAGRGSCHPSDWAAFAKVRL